MECPSCKKKCSEDAGFCSNCGGHIRRAPSAAAPLTEAQQDFLQRFKEGQRRSAVERDLFADTSKKRKLKKEDKKAILFSLITRNPKGELSIRLNSSCTISFDVTSTLESMLDAVIVEHPLLKDIEGVQFKDFLVNKQESLGTFDARETTQLQELKVKMSIAFSRMRFYVAVDEDKLPQIRKKKTLDTSSDGSAGEGKNEGCRVEPQPMPILSIDPHLSAHMMRTRSKQVPSQASTSAKETSGQQEIGKPENLTTPSSSATTTADGKDIRQYLVLVTHPTHLNDTTNGTTSTENVTSAAIVQENVKTVEEMSSSNSANTTVSMDSSSLPLEVRLVDNDNGFGVGCTLDEKSKSMLLLWRDGTRLKEKIVVDVIRETLVHCLRQSWKFLSDDLVKTPNVCFVGEVAEDFGGPRREMFRILVNEISIYSGLFEEVDGGFCLVHNATYMKGRRFFQLGQMIAWSILHGGPGLHYLAPQCVSAMSETDCDLYPWVQYVKDEKLKEALGRLADCENDDDWLIALEALDPLVSENGFPILSRWKVQDKKKLVQDILYYHYFTRNSKAYSDLKEGMNDVGGLWDNFSAFPSLATALLVFNPIKITHMALRELFDVQFSPPGSNNLRKEKNTMFCFYTLLKILDENVRSDCPLEENGLDEFFAEFDKVLTPEEVQKLSELPDAFRNMEAKLTLPELLSFATGADRVPPLGYAEKIEITWFDNKKEYPTVSTCALQMTLPRDFQDVEEFYQHMKEAIKGSEGYFGFK